jgi:hypothetical protein
MWKIQIQDKERIEDLLKITVLFSGLEGKESFTHLFTFSSGITSDEIKRIIGEFAERLEEVDNLLVRLPSGEISMETAAPVSTETEQQLFQKKIRKLQSAQRAIDLGVLDSSDSSYKTLLDSVKADMKPDFINLF